MSDQPDDSQKTEEPSEKKLTDARRKGDLPVSREVATAAGIGAAAGLAAFALPGMALDTARSAIPFYSNAHQIRLDASYRDVGAAYAELFTDVIWIISPMFLAFAGAAFLAAFAQNAVVFAPDRIKPKAERINPMKGMKRLFSPSAIVELAKSMTKVGIAAVVVVLFTLQELGRLSAAATYDVATVPGRLQSVAVRLLAIVLVTSVAITVLDVLWRRFEWKKKLKMTRQEVKDEHKQMEGDPHVKARLAEIRRSRARRARISKVPEATVLVMNPTHYAVALRYTPGVDAAPLCIAKGRNLIALKMREMAESHNVPVVENPPLARALHAALEEDQPIPAEFYQAVAEIINFVYKSGKRAISL
jgi:flagellar biosynthetic protein FlhB